MPTNQAERFRHRILVVDDEATVRNTAQKVLTSRGYEVQTAEDGFDALRALSGSLPDLIVSDLRMPNMSGFEFLSVVRRRFPHIPVVVISAAFNGIRPTGVLADAFFAKGSYTPVQLFEKIAEWLAESPIRPHAARQSHAPVWIPRSPTGYYVLTCSECLRSFSIPQQSASEEEVQEEKCLFCDCRVQFILGQGFDEKAT